MTGEAHRRLLPILLDMHGRRAVVFGSDARSVGVVRDLLASGAHVTIITGGSVMPEVASLAREGLAFESRSYVRGDLLGASLALCFLDDEELRRAVAAEANAVGCMLHAPGAPSLSSFTMPGLESDDGESPKQGR